MNGGYLGIGTAIAAVGALIGLRELRWRRRVAAELQSEVALGILSSGDLEALRGWKRFRQSWLSGSRERRAFSRIAGRLARAKEAQKRASGERGRLLQVQVLTLRTRLRQMHATRRAGSDSDAAGPYSSA